MALYNTIIGACNEVLMDTMGLLTVSHDRYSPNGHIL